MLYCEVASQSESQNQPNFGNRAKASFLGYDYAYPSGAYFSVILNEVLYPETNFALSWKTCLNQYGLVPSFEVMQSLVKERKLLVDGSDLPIFHEVGDFAIYRVFCMGDKGTEILSP